MVCDLSQDDKGNVKPEEQWPTDEYWGDDWSESEEEFKILGQLSTQVMMRSLGHLLPQVTRRILGQVLTQVTRRILS